MPHTSPARLVSRTLWAMLCIVLPLALVCGCSTASSAKPAPTKPTGYMALYESGRYADAYEDASRTAGSPRGGNPRAAVIAGLSAMALNRNAEAERWLKPYVDSADPWVAGQSSAALGLIAKEQKRPAEAVDLLVKASSRLRGDESARALMYAGDASREQKKESQAVGLYTQARDKVETDAGLRMMIGDRLAKPGLVPTYGSKPSMNGPFSVQAGAFAERSKAEALARRVANQGPTRIYPILARGRPMYAVRIGPYGTKAAAETVRRRVGTTAFLVSE